MADERTLSYIDTTRAGSGRGFPTACLVAAMDCHRPLMAPARFSLATIERVELGRGAAERHRACERLREDGASVLRIAFDDNWLSSKHARLTRGELGWTLVDAGSKNGTFVNNRRVTTARLRDGDIIEIGSALLLFRDGIEWTLNDPVDCDLAATGADRGPLATLSVELTRQIELLRRIAPATTPVLIFGDSGAGKEVFARALHELSGRTGAFVAVNCGALPSGLVESQLFGHRRGAFSGADSHHDGLVRAAHGGTLFLDEIAELPEASQVALLRVLQEGEVTPVGATRPERVDLRVVAATHQDIAERRASGRFRDDLYGRLAGASIRLPRLAERREDLGLIAGNLLRRIAGERATRLGFARQAGYALLAYEWPLNIRELEHALATAVALAEGDVIDLEHLPPAVRKATKRGAKPANASAAGEPTDKSATTADELEHLLAAHGGNISAVARAMRRSRVHVHRLLKRFGIDPARFRS